MPGFTDYKLKMTILADGYQAKSEIKSVDDQITKMGGGLASGLGGLAGPIGLAAAGLAGVATAAVGATAAVFNLTKQAAEYGSVIYDAKTKTGLHAETISTLSLAAKQADTDLNSVTGGIAKFAKTVGAAADGSADAAKKLKDFGVTPQEAINDLDGTLDKVFRRIYEAKPGIEQITLAQKAFGKSGADLLPIIDQMGGELESTRKKFEAMGLTISDKDAAAADEFGDQMTLLGAQIEMAGIKIGQSFMPAFLNMANSLSNWLSQNSGEITHWAGVAAYGFETVIKGAGVAIDALKNYYSGYKNFMEGIGLGFLVPKPFIATYLDEQYQKSLTGQPNYTGKGARAFSPSLDLDLSDGGRTGGIKPPKTTDDQFRKFFQDLGFTVNRTFGEAINKGSLHPSGKAIDISVRGKTEDDIAKLIAAAIEKGYRFVDERVKQPGIISHGQHLHFEQNYGEKPSIFADASMYGGVPLDLLKQLDESRRGKGPASERSITDFYKKQNTETLATVRDGLEKEVALRQSFTETQKSLIEQVAAQGLFSEKDAFEARTKLDEDFLNFKLEQLKKEGEAVEGNADLEADVAQRMALLQDEITRSHAKNVLDRIELSNKEIQKIRDEHKALEELEELRERSQSARDHGKFKDAGERVRPEDQFAKLREHFSDSSNDFGVAAVDAATLAFQQLGEAVGNAVQAFVLYGNAGASVRQVTAQILASIAQQAAVQAIYELAQGLAVLALAFFGVPNAGPSATAHFAAAAAYGLIGGVAAIAGRAVAGDSFKNKGGSGSGKGGPGSTGAYSYGTGANQDQTPYTRASQNAYVSGRDDNHARFVADAIDRLNDTITQRLQNAKAGDVLTAGIQQRPGLIGNTVVSDVKRNSGTGTSLQRAMGVNK